MSRPDVRDLEITVAHATRTAIEQLKVAKDAAVLWADAADADPSQLRPLYRALFELQTEYQCWLPIEPGHLRDTAPESPAAASPGVTTPADPAQAAHGDAGGQEAGSGANDTRVVQVPLPGPDGWNNDDCEWSTAEPDDTSTWYPCWTLDTQGAYASAWGHAVDLDGTVHTDLDGLARDSAKLLAAIEYARAQQARGGEQR